MLFCFAPLCLFSMSHKNQWECDKQQNAKQKCSTDVASQYSESLLSLQLHSGWPLSPSLAVLRGWHFIKRPCDGAAASRAIRPSSTSSLSGSWCAFCLVPNDSCDGTVMACDHTDLQPRPPPPCPFSETELWRSDTSSWSHLISCDVHRQCMKSHSRNRLCFLKCVYVYVYIGSCRHKKYHFVQCKNHLEGSLDTWCSRFLLLASTLPLIVLFCLLKCKFSQCGSSDDGELRLGCSRWGWGVWR